MFRNLAATFATSMCIVAMAAPAQAQTRSYDIPAGTLKSTLDAFARQSGRQIIYRLDDVRGTSSPGVRGRLTADHALRAILIGTGFGARFDASGAVAIVRMGNSPAAAPEHGDNPAGVAASPSEPANAQIVVTGSRLPSSPSASIAIFDEKKINQLGVNQVADVLRYLPQQSFQTTETTSYAGARAVQLRGLGLGTTLVLINGRRTVTSALQGTRNVFDLNMIPLAAVERIEVFTESASSVYGADAIGGVLNVILKDEVDRPTADLYYGTARGGGAEYQGSLAFSVPSDRLHNIFVFEFFRRTSLIGDERGRTRDADFRRFGGTDYRVETANPGNVCSVDGANLPGLPAPCAAVPEGSSGVGLTPSDFLATAGSANLYSPYSDLALIPAGERYSVMSRLQYDLSPSVSAFGELLFVRRSDRYREPATAIDFGYVPETNPFNPFGVPVFVNYRFDLEAVGPQVSRFKSRAWRLVGGFKGEFEKGDWEASALYTHDRGSNVTTNRMDQAAIAAALAETDPARALNVFQDGPGGSAALLASLREIDPPVDRLKSRALQGTVFARRELLDLPGGPLEAVVGAEARNEAIDIDAASFAITVSPDRDTKSGFFEVRAPLIGRDQAFPLVDRLTITASGRYDHYSDFGGTFNPRGVIEWAPTRDLALRGAYSTSFRAPALFELYLPETRIPGIPVLDPRRGDVAFVDITVSGNPDLDPEKARSLTAGFLYTPRWASGLRLGATYWLVKQKKRVVRTDPFTILFNESVFPDLIVRAPPTPADIAAGLPGRLLEILSPSVNSGKVNTSGIDFEASANIDTAVGRFSPSLTGTWVASYKAADFVFQRPTQRVGLAQIEGTIPEWRVVGALSWSKGGFSAFANARYLSSYDDVDQFGERNGKRVDPPIVIDAQLSVELGKLPGVRTPWLSGSVLRAGALNLFDANAPFSEVNGAYGYDTTQSEIRGRFVYVKLTQAF